MMGRVMSRSGTRRLLDTSEERICECYAQGKTFEIQARGTDRDLFFFRNDSMNSPWYVLQKEDRERSGDG